MCTKVLQKICCCIKRTSPTNASSGANGAIASRASLAIRRGTITNFGGFLGGGMAQNQMKDATTAQQRWATITNVAPQPTTVAAAVADDSQLLKRVFRASSEPAIVCPWMVQQTQQQQTNEQR